MGVSLQECVVPDITIGDVVSGGSVVGGTARIASVAWKRFRLTVTLDREPVDLDIEVRREARDPTSRIEATRVGGDGPRVELRVDPDVDEETPVAVVVVDAHGSVLDAKTTAIGVS